MGARLAAARTLIALERGQSTLAAEVERDRRDLADPRDRGLFLEITSGVLRWRAELDACLAAHTTRPLAQLEPAVRAVLRAAAYQFLHLDRVPAHAIVNESVDVTRRLRQERAAGFVNAVLRSLSRDTNPRRSLPVRPASADDAAASLAFLSVTMSHPLWLVERWLNREGLDAAVRWCEFNNAPPDLTVRPGSNTDLEHVAKELAATGVESNAARFAPNALRLPAGTFGRLEERVQKLLIVQDEGSQLVALATAVRPGQRVLDVCAAPGGKTLLLHAMTGAEGVVVAGDNRPARVHLLRDRLSQQVGRSPVLALDASTSLPFGPVFDHVLLDAPCSGLGTLRRDPDLKWTRTPEDFPRFRDRQLHMIRAAADTVRRGGALTYATCSSEPEENDEVVAAFLAERRDFEQEPIHFGDAAPDASTVVDDGGALRTRPFRDNLDAYFAVRLVRSDGA